MKQKLEIDPERRIRILIIRLSSIGDIVQCSGVPRVLKSRFPNAILDWVVREDCAELLSSNPYVTHVIPFNRKLGLKGWLALSKKLNEELYTHVYDAHNNIRSRILCFILNPRLLIRRSKNRIRRLLLHKFKINLFGNSFRGVDSFIDPLTAWGVVNDKKGSELFLESELFLKTLDTFEDSTKKFIALAPATAWPKKNWPLDHWKELIKLILSKTDYHVIILGGPNDIFCNDLVLNKTRTTNLQGKLSLLESAAAAKQCLTLIAADTGVLHMTEAVGKAVVGLLGPTFFGHPYLAKSKTIQKNLWCQPCSKDGSGVCYNPTFQKCMKLITPHEVFNQMMNLTSGLNPAESKD
jgi:ADP-heptose:LPS heptosyltransferase